MTNTPKEICPSVKWAGGDNWFYIEEYEFAHNPISVRIWARDCVIDALISQLKLLKIVMKEHRKTDDD